MFSITISKVTGSSNIVSLNTRALSTEFSHPWPQLWVTIKCTCDKSPAPFEISILPSQPVIQRHGHSMPVVQLTVRECRLPIRRENIYRFELDDVKNIVRVVIGETTTVRDFNRSKVPRTQERLKSTASIMNSRDGLTNRARAASAGRSGTGAVPRDHPLDASGGRDRFVQAAPHDDARLRTLTGRARLFVSSAWGEENENPLCKEHSVQRKMTRQIPHQILITCVGRFDVDVTEATYGRGNLAQSFSSRAIAEKWSRAVCKSSAISLASTSGSGKLPPSSSESFLSQKRSRLALSRLMISS